MLQDTFFNSRNPARAGLNCRGTLLDLSTPVVMGVFNITPDSFFDGGRYVDDKDMLAQVEKMLSDGAAIIDVGAQSTRPRATFLTANEESNRLMPALRLLRRNFPDAVFSVDTFYAEVAKAAVHEGVDIVNDVSGGTIDPGMFDTIAELKVPYILMHIQGAPQTMQREPHYEDVVKEVLNYFIERVNQLWSKGVHDIIIDPGFGFGKTNEHNYSLLKHLDLFRMLDCPVMAGVSRKSMINKVLNIKAAEALNGTTVLNTIALMKGANILRVHDVKEAVEAIKLVEHVNSYIL